MTIESRCLECRNFINNGNFGCKAFDEIPKDILFNRLPHDIVIDGQKGEFVYNPKGQRIDNNET